MLGNKPTRGNMMDMKTVLTLFGSLTLCMAGVFLMIRIGLGLYDDKLRDVTEWSFETRQALQDFFVYSAWIAGGLFVGFLTFLIWILTELENKKRD